jgi:hypothetical protein
VYYIDQDDIIKMQLEYKIGFTKENVSMFLLEEVNNKGHAGVLCDTLLHLKHFFADIIISFAKGGPGAAVEPTVCNRKVPGSSPSLCILCG